MPGCWFIAFLRRIELSTSRIKVVVAMSGGVDSSVAACLLAEQGYDVTGVFMRTGVAAAKMDGEDSAQPSPCGNVADANDARAVAEQIGVPFFALDFQEPFDGIIDYFVEEYRRGRTPNPCIVCNQRLKFGRLMEYGRSVGADCIATGHYARIDSADGQWQLRRGWDADKDQSYVLSAISRDVLGKIRLPIGGLSKQQVREYAQRFSLRTSEKPESQDICFVPDRDYTRLLRERAPECFVPGVVMDSSGRPLGRHEGIVHFTIGQRRGLGVAMGKPAYVTRIDADRHTVTIGPREELACDHLTASGMNWLIDPPAQPFDAHVQIRYSHRAAVARVFPLPESQAEVKFSQPQYAVTPGQAAVIYDGDRVLGGGWIR